MTVTRGIAVAPTFAAVAVGAASPAWADQTMSGHDIETVTDPSSGQSITNDWYFTPCGDGCASVVSNGAAAVDTPIIALFTRPPSGRRVIATRVVQNYCHSVPKAYEFAARLLSFCSQAKVCR
jgi:hypothetical protein